MSKNIQISQELFYELVRYFILDEVTEPRLNAIKSGLEVKIDNMVKHELYTQYKTEKDPIKADEARKQYLDKIGLRDSFRW